MFLIHFLGIIVSFAATVPVSELFECKQENRLRNVDILYANPQTRIPRQVNYVKKTELPNEIQVLWMSETDPKFCEKKANEFVKSLQTKGWKCDTAMVN